MRSHVLLCLLFCVISGERNDESEIISDSIFRLGAKLLETTGESCVLSPFSLAMTLGNLNNGVLSNEITRNVFHGVSKEAVNKWFSSILPPVMEKEPIASKICINPFVSVDSKFKRDSELYYKMRLKSFDFTDNLDDAIRLINDYIQAATNGRIRDMVDANDVDSDTEFFVPSAFFMDVKFDQPFHKGRTVTKPFYTENGVVKQVNMMNAALYDRNVRLITTWKKTRRWSQGQSFEQEKDP
ncbi:hypothetical protein QR680_004293 [Steinernema hermaphroditum]|uniref:Serpin domain-containing protein n=1 Tax=Steinernema hermaphroditum TaxID=289476 RepID=A0AA39HN96_9BILA|nr:hypothetical protein QR680_004293 [Steinernema hermaphroditum]